MSVTVKVKESQWLQMGEALKELEAAFFSHSYGEEGLPENFKIARVLHQSLCAFYISETWCTHCAPAES